MVYIGKVPGPAKVVKSVQDFLTSVMKVEFETMQKEAACSHLFHSKLLEVAGKLDEVEEETKITHSLPGFSLC